jgi:hypothetical protein
MRRIHDDPAGLDTVAESAQVIREFAHASLDGRGAFHVPESDLDRDCHDAESLCWTVLVDVFIVEPRSLRTISIDRRDPAYMWQEYTARSARREPNLA